jgi:hypothetical protein
MLTSMLVALVVALCAASSSSSLEGFIISRNLEAVSAYIDPLEQQKDLELVADLLIKHFSESFVTSILQTNVNGFVDVLLREALAGSHCEVAEIALMHSYYTNKSDLLCDLPNSSKCVACHEYVHNLRSAHCSTCISKACFPCSQRWSRGCPGCRNSSWPTQTEIPQQETAMYNEILTNLKNPEYSWVELSKLLGQTYFLPSNHLTILFKQTCDLFTSPPSSDSASRNAQELFSSKFLLILKRNGADVNYDDSECLRTSSGHGDLEFTKYLISKVKVNVTQAISFSASTEALTGLSHFLKSLTQSQYSGIDQPQINAQTRSVLVKSGIPAADDTDEIFLVRNELRQSVIALYLGITRENYQTEA